MANVYLPGLIQARAQYDTDPDTGRFPENVVWFLSSSTTTPTEANLAAMQTVFDENWPAVWTPVGSSTYHYVGSVLTDWSSNTGLQVTSSPLSAPVVGARGGQPLPRNVSALISYAIALRYKGGHPRTYLPYLGAAAMGTVQTDVIQSEFTSEVASNFSSMVTAMKTSGVLGGQTFVCFLHRTNALKATTYQVSSYNVNGTVATQRRRLRKVPHH